MARPLRIHVMDGWYHVTSWGVEGRKLFRRGADRQRFLELVGELPGRFGAEVHAFVLMGNHYHLLVRCRRSDLSETLRWLQTSFSVWWNLEHRRRGRVFQGRFKSLLIRDESRLEEVARHLHLNPVRIGGLGLSAEDQRRARVTGRADPEQGLVARRIVALNGYAWSSWPSYVGLRPAQAWLSTDRLLGETAGSGTSQRRSALVAYTEAPIRDGRLESPWRDIVGSAVLGEARDAGALIRKTAKDPAKARRVVESAAKKARVEWLEMVKTAESICGRTWKQMCTGYGEWGRDALVAVATRHLGWRLIEVSERIPDARYGALAQGVRRFWRQAAERPEYQEFVRRMRG